MDLTAPATPATPAPLPVLSPLPGRLVRDPVLLGFADEVGGVDAGAVTIAGGRTQWELGGPPPAGVRELRAPAGVVELEPAEMTVRVRAGTPVAEVREALAPFGQCVALPEPGEGATVGGVLAVGRADVRRLGWGPVRDTLLQARYVSAEGLVITAGGPTVKNVTGFDLARVLVGSLGTLGFLGEVILRTRPRPEASQWLAGEAEPHRVRDALYRPMSVLWDGERTFVLLEGHRADVDAEAAAARRLGLAEVDGPPPLPPHRRSLRPGEIPALTGRFVAEVGVGVVHVPDQVPPPPLAPPLAELNRRLKERFDPTGRLNPGRDPAAR